MAVEPLCNCPETALKLWEKVMHLSTAGSRICQSVRLLALTHDDSDTAAQRHSDTPNDDDNNKKIGNAVSR